MHHRLHPRFLLRSAKEFGHTQAELFRMIALWEREDKSLYLFLIQDLGGLAEDLHKGHAFHSRDEFERYMDDLIDYFKTVEKAADRMGNTAHTARLFLFAQLGVRRIQAFREAALQTWDYETASRRLELFLQELRETVNRSLLHELDKPELLAHHLEEELSRPRVA